MRTVLPRMSVRASVWGRKWQKSFAGRRRTKQERTRIITFTLDSIPMKVNLSTLKIKFHGHLFVIDDVMRRLWNEVSPRVKPACVLHLYYPKMCVTPRDRFHAATAGLPQQVSFFGAMNMLGLAKRVNARILQASTSEVQYG